MTPPKAALAHDPFFDESYVRLYLREGEELFSFEYTEGNDRFRTLSIKRPIQRIGDRRVEEGFFDLESAYGYGGYLATTTESGFLSRAFDAYTDHCREERIVAEFVRFHPFTPGVESFGRHLDFFIDDRPTVAMAAEPDKEARHAAYSSKVRRKIRKCERDLRFEPEGEIETFMALYYETMQRNRAEGFYFFDEAYFRRLAEAPFCRLVQVRDDEEVVSMGLLLVGRDIAHMHLSANRAAKMRLNGNYLLFDASAGYAAKLGCRHLFLGGGRTPDPDDSLLRFKRQFASFELPFYIGGRIFLPDRYHRYVSAWEAQHPDTRIRYFLKYRLEGPDG